MQLNTTNTKLKQSRFNITVPKMGSQDIFIPFKEGFDFKKVLKAQTSCRCSEPEIWADGILVKYSNASSDLKGAFVVEELSIYVVYKPEDENIPLEVVNAQNVVVTNWDGLEWEEVKVSARIENSEVKSYLNG